MSKKAVIYREQNKDGINLRFGIPKNAKTVHGHDIKKLPPNYPMVKSYEDEFKNNYRKEFGDLFLKKIVKVING